MSAHHVHMCVPLYRHVCTCKPMSVDDRARCFLQLIFTLLFFLRHSVSTEPGAPWFSQTEWPGNWESLVFVSPVLAFIGADQHNPHVSARDLNSSTPSCTSMHLTYWIFPACTWQLRDGFWIWQLRWFLHEHTDIHPSCHEAGVALDSFALRNAKT